MRMISFLFCISSILFRLSSISLSAYMVIIYKL